MYKLPYLQKYKGKSTRYKCPSCGRNQSFTLYLDGNSHEPIHRTVGRCNREIKCGYHYTPKQYFTDNPQKLPSHLVEGLGVRSTSPPLRGGLVGLGTYTSKLQTVNCKLPTSLMGTIPFPYLINSLSPASNFVSFLHNHFSEEQINQVFEKYLLGATKNTEVIFWQIDIAGKIRTGKIMQYNPQTGKRIKHQNGAIDWVHNKLKKSGALLEAFNLQQCFFGEHLLTLYPDKSVAIVESEKSAIIASSLIPNMIWLAVGNINGLSFEKCKVLKNRNVILYPDLGAFEKWKEKAQTLNSLFLSPHGEGSGMRLKITVSTLLEDEATDTDRTNGLDIADYIIEEMKAPLPKTNNTNFPLPMERVSEGQERSRGAGGEVITQIQSLYTHQLEQMIVKNPSIIIPIDKLQLVQI